MNEYNIEFKYKPAGSAKYDYWAFAYFHDRLVAETCGDSWEEAEEDLIRKLKARVPTPSPKTITI